MKITKVILCFILFGSFNHIIGQNQAMNMVELGSFNPVSETYNDVWGLELGNEDYAIFGSVSNIYIVDVTDCNNPVQKAELSPVGTTNIWRDFKTKDGYIYAVCDDCNQGLVIINANVLPSGTPTIDYQSSGFFSRAHNIFIDGDYLYAVGTNTASEGFVILDISSPLSPSLVTNVNLDIQKNGSNSASNFYVHDLNIKDDVAYCSHGVLDEFAAWDVSDPLNITYIESYVTGNYAHSSWNTDDDQYAYVAEEVPNGLPLRIIDLIDNSGNIGMTQVGTFSHSIESSGASTPHNPFVKGDTLYISHYQDGVKLFNISNPTNPSLIGYFDTYTDNDGIDYGSGPTYKGCWGVYPYLSSGCILATDGKYGLKVLKYDLTVPVLLDYFDIEKTPNNKAILSWQTESQRNLSHIKILRKTNSKDFQEIAQIQNTADLIYSSQYEFLDENTIPGKNYYKLLFIDYDGSILESDIKSVEFPAVNNNLVIAPNPSNGKQFFILKNDFEDDASVHILNSLGEKIHFSHVAKSENLWTVYFGKQLHDGIYVLQIVKDNSIISAQHFSVQEK